MSVAYAAPPLVTADAVLAAGLDQLQAALDVLASVDATALSGLGLGEASLALLQARRRVDATAAVVMGRFAHGHDWSADGARSPEAWIHGRVNDGFGIARRPREHARVTAQFPALTQAWRDGAVGAGHLEAVETLLRRYPALHSEIVAADVALTDIAREWEPRRFHDHMRALCHRLNAEAVTDADRRERTATRLHASITLDGFVRVDGLLDPVVGGRLLAALEAARRTLVSDTDDAENASDAGAPRHERHVSQRNVDALARILDAASACDTDQALPTVCGERPTINVTVPLEVLTEPSASESGWLERFGAPATMVSASDVRRLACDASLRPLLVDRDGQLIAMLPKVRTIHPALRRAVLMRDQRCRFPGCRQRIDEVHHIVFHSHGGPTVLGNLVGLCWFHHHQVHDAGWLLEGDPGGSMRFMSPTGRALTSHPPGLVRWKPPDESSLPF